MQFLFCCPVIFRVRNCLYNVHKVPVKYWNVCYDDPIVITFSPAGNQTLEISPHYKYSTAQELVTAVNQSTNKRLPRHSSYALLSNAKIFLVNSSISDTECLSNGCIALIGQESWCNLKLDYAKYTTTKRHLKERLLKVWPLQSRICCFSYSFSWPKRASVP